MRVFGAQKIQSLQSSDARIVVIAIQSPCIGELDSSAFGLAIESANRRAEMILADVQNFASRGRLSISLSAAGRAVLDRLAELSLRGGARSSGGNCGRSRRARLLLLELGEQQRFFAGLGQFREVVLHAGLDPPAAGLNAGASMVGVCLAGLGYRHVT